MQPPVTGTAHIQIKRGSLLIENNVGTYNMDGCIQHLTTTPGAYDSTAPFTQRMKCCIIWVAISYMKSDVRD